MARMKWQDHQEILGVEKLGTLYFEGRIIPGYTHLEKQTQEKNLEILLSSYPCLFDHGENILGNSEVLRFLTPLFCADMIQELRIVEAQKDQEPKLESTDLYCTTEWTIKVHLYTLYDKEDTIAGDSDESQKADLTHLPNIRFDKQWERLTYECGWKDTMLNMATNLVNPADTQETRERCPLILLHGPAGTGKTTFAQSLAQKLSIRLSSQFLETKLFEIRTAMLFSRYFGESARFVDEVFVKIRKASEGDGHTLIVVLIDEVESLAGSRQTSMEKKEAQDGLKATNTLLTHLDKMKFCKNVLLVCTTNFLDALDKAFVDRCICQKKISLPKRRTQYEILRNQVQGLMFRGFILSKVNFAEYAEAKRTYREKECNNATFRLYNFLKRIRGMNKKGNSPTRLSGRYLAGLPGNALDMYKRGTVPSLDDAFVFFEKYATLEYGAPHEDEDSDSDSEEDEEVEKRSKNGGLQMENSPEDNLDLGLEGRGNKRNCSALVIEGSEEDIEEAVRDMKKRRINVRSRKDNVDPGYGERLVE